MKLYLANLYLAAFLYLDVNCQCWKQSYARGIGTPPTKCPLNKEKNGALCYNKCESNYYGVGALCLQACPSDYNDYGVLCYRSYISQNKNCTNRSIQSCEPCENGFTSNGFCCIKETDFFFKKSYSRDAGQPMNCLEGEEQSSGLCYQKCKQNYIGNGPVCWFDCKDTQYSYDCGVLCVNNSRQCAQFGTGASAAGLDLAGTLFVVPEVFIYLFSYLPSQTERSRITTNQMTTSQMTTSEITKTNVTGIAQASSVKVLQTNLKSNLAEESPDDQAPDHLMTINRSTFC